MSNITNVGVQFTVTSNLSSLTAEVNALNAKLAQHLALMSKMEDRSAFTQNLVSSYKNAADASGLFNTQLVNLGTQVDQLGRRIERNQLKLSEYRKYMREARKGIVGDVGELAKAQARMRTSMVLDSGDGKFLVSTAKGIDMAAQKTAVMNEKIKIQNTLIRQGNESLINWGKNTQWAGRQLTVGLTVPMTIFGALASKVFRDADKELTRLQKVYGDGISKPTIEDLKTIRGEVLELSKTLTETRGGSLNDILATAADIAATGKTGQELLDTIDQTNRFAVLGDIGRETAIKSTLALQTAFRQDTNELVKSINFLNAAENSTSLSMDDMAEAIPRAGTVVKGLGGDIEDLTLYMVAMREGGIDAAEGANALKSGLASIINPSTKAKKILSGYGIDIEKIVEVNKGELTPTILALQSELSQLDGLARSRSITALFGKYQFARMSALFNNINAEGSQTKQIFELIGKSAQELAEQAEGELKTKTESLSNRWERALNRIKNAMLPIGETFTKIAIPIMNLAAKILEIFNGLPSAIKMTVVALTALAAIAGPIIMTMGIMANLMGQMKQGWRATTGLGLKMMGRERQEMGPLLTPEVIAHQEALKKDSNSIISHASVLDAAAMQLRSLGTTLIDNAVAPAFKASNAPFFDAMRHPTTTDNKVSNKRTNEQMAVQLMGDSLSGRSMVGGLLSSNPTGGNVGLVPAHYRWLETQDLKYAAASVAALDSTMATQLLGIDEAVRRSKFGDGFAAYSHLWAEEGSTPLGSFIEWQKPNNARSGDVSPGELPAQFVAGQKQAMAALLAGGGASLYAEAQRNPQLKRALQFHISAMEASKKEFEGRNSEEFVRLMRSMAGESAEAMEETRRRITAIGDQWKTQAVGQLTLSGINPGSIDAVRSSTPPPPVETKSPGRVYRPVPAPVMETVVNKQLQREWTESLRRQVGDREVDHIRMRNVQTSQGEYIQILELLSNTGETLAYAQKTASGKLGVAMNGLAQKSIPAVGVIPGRTWQETPDSVRKRELVERNNVLASEQAAARRALEMEKSLPTSARPLPSVKLLDRAEAASIRGHLAAINNETSEVSDNLDKSAKNAGVFGNKLGGAVASAGLLSSTMLMFVGNTENAAVQVAFMAATLASMVPVMGALVPQMVRARATNIASGIQGSLTGLISKARSSVPMIGGIGRALSAAMFSPWTAAAAAAILVVAFFVKKNRDAYDKARRDAEEYSNAVKATVSPNLAEDNKSIIGLDTKIMDAANGWKNYSISIGAAATANKSYIEQMKDQNAELIEGLSKLNDDDLKRRLESIYKGLIINGATESQAQMFIDSLGALLEKKPVTVQVNANLKGWADGKKGEDLLNDSINNAGNSIPTDVELSKQQTGVLIPQPVWSDAPQQFSETYGLYLEREIEKGKPRFDAAGAEIGSAIAQGITSGLITPENGKLGEYVDAMYQKIKTQIVTSTNGQGVINSLLSFKPDEIKNVFNSVGVPIEQGIDGLVDKFMLLDRAGRDNLIASLRALGPEGDSLANTLTTVDSATGAAVLTIADADQELGNLIQTAGQNGNFTALAASMNVTADAMSNAATTGDQLNSMFKAQAAAARKNFFDLAQKNIDNYVKNVKKRNDQMVENVRDSAQKQVEAVREAERAKMDAIKDAQEKRQKQAEDRIERTRNQYDAEIEAIQKAEDARQRAFEAEQERIRRLTEQRNFNIDYAKAVAEGDLFGAARIRNEQDASKKSYAVEDAQEGSQTATEKRIARIEVERDKKIEAQEAALEAQRETDEASIESAQKASDARIEAVEAASEAQIEAAEKTAERSNEAAASAVEGMKKIKEQAIIAWDAAITRGEDGVAEAQFWGPKLGIPAKRAAQIFRDEYARYPGIVAGGLQKTATDPEVLRQARLVGINTIAATLGLQLSDAERKFVSRPGVDLGFYFGERISGKSFNDIRNAGIYAAAGGPETSYIPGRQVGGNVYKGMPYIVGETGHELFVPGQSGTIINNRDLKKMGREGGMGGLEGSIGALGTAIAVTTARAISGKMAESIKRRGQTGSGSGSGMYAGPVNEGNGIFDGGFSYPFGGRFRISSPFGWRNSPHGYGRMFHSGTDIAAPMGTPIKAIGGGIARSVGWDPAKDPRGRPWLGLRTILDHGGGWTSYYGHQSELLVKQGQRVSEGQRIGLVGSTGASTGPHLHLTIKSGGNLVNPGMVIPGLAKGAKINYDNTIANLHKGEAVLTAPITSKFEQLANQMSYNTGYGDVKVIFTGPVNSEVDVEAGVTAALNKRDLKMGKGRKIG